MLIESNEHTMNIIGYCFVKPNGKYLVRYQYYSNHKSYYGWRDTTDVEEATVFTSMKLPKNVKKERGYPRGASFNWLHVYRFIRTTIVE